MKYKCYIAKPIKSCEKCNHSKPHNLEVSCNGTCFGEGHETSEGEKVDRIVVACVEIPESIEAEEL